ncbi:flagellar assembly protein FliH [Halomonas sp. HP20-15]|uniref:flagellar assembly protein FliH n=1 Tax=Halomonas sp. HP20-15 TaxID=3085901 RepID=UPI002982823D|nr:flagellar assembly protein FliH [Halomonas sp. HP20-15]MDW5375710.1 flagellar assembly protein FliH [Halomonas sp. HP20-15]
MSDHLVSPEHDDGAWRRWRMDELGSPDQLRSQRERRERVRQQAAQRQAELDAMRKQARQEAYQAGYQEGYEQGQQAGYEAGLKEGREAGEVEMQRQTRETLEPLLPLAAQFGEALAALDEEMAEHLVDLALATGRQLAGEALEARPEAILDIVRELLHVEPSLSGRPRLWLHPADLALVKAQLGHEFEAAGWQLQPDDLVSRGGCRATSANGDLDATLESRWETIANQVRRRNSVIDTNEKPS